VPSVTRIRLIPSTSIASARATPSFADRPKMIHAPTETSQNGSVSFSSCGLPLRSQAHLLRT
jgi:hypothetical protein